MLHWAAASGNTDMLAFLLERAVDPNMPSYAGQTPLQVAAGRGHDACLRLLLSENAQPNLGDHAFLQQAGSGGFWTRTCSGVSLITDIACMARTVCKAILVPTQGSMRCAVDLRGDTALHEAAGGGYEPAARTLLAGRANPNAVGHSGETPLIRAARRGHRNVIEVGELCRRTLAQACRGALGLVAPERALPA